MSTENPNQQVDNQAATVNLTKDEKSKAKKESTPIFKEKVCLSFSFTAIAIAILNSSGLLTELPRLMTVAFKEQPAGTLFIAFVLSVFATIILSNFMPKKISVLGRTPIFIFATFCFIKGWNGAIEKFGANGGTNMIWIVLATAILGFCVAYHNESESEVAPSLSARIEWGVWVMICANIATLVLTTMIAGAFIGSIKDNVEAKIEQEVREQELMYYLWDACPLVKSAEYCDALKIVTAR